MTPGVLTRELGADAVAVYVGGVLLSLDDVGPVTITHGRRDVDEQPAPATCTLAMHSTALPALPEIGDWVAVDLGDTADAPLGLATPELAAAARHRFLGTVTDVQFSPAGAAGGPGVVSLTAASVRARLGRVGVTPAGWPRERDGDRAARILAAVAAELGLTVGLVDPGTVDVVARTDTSATSAEQLLADLGRDVVGQLAERRDGALAWHDADHLRGATPAVDLTAANVIRDTTPTQRLAGLVNDLTIEYDGGSTRLVDTASTDPITGNGPFPAELRTQLADAAEAESLAMLTIGRKSWPWWDIGDGLDVDLLRTCTVATAAQLLAVDTADLIRVSGFPADGPFQLKLLAVEGWTEAITRNSWRIRYAVSDMELTGPALRWIDVRPDDLTWADYDPAIRWLDVIGYRPGFGHGLWVDVPAADRWLTHAPDTTWADAPTS